YVSDAGRSCGVKFINSGTQGVLDAFSLVAAHEYAETLTDQFPPGGWTNPESGEELADACAWISSGPGHATNVSLPTGKFALQRLGSSDPSPGAIAQHIRERRGMPSRCRAVEALATPRPSRPMISTARATSSALVASRPRAR